MAYHLLQRSPNPWKWYLEPSLSPPISSPRSHACARNIYWAFMLSSGKEGQVIKRWFMLYRRKTCPQYKQCETEDLLAERHEIWGEYMRGGWLVLTGDLKKASRRKNCLNRPFGSCCFHYLEFLLSWPFIPLLSKRAGIEILGYKTSLHQSMKPS